MIAYVINGRFVEGNRLEVEIDQPYFAHGAGLFETLRGYRGRPCHLRAHSERMLAAARALDVSVAHEPDAIAAQVDELLRRTGLEHARVKLHLLVREDRSSDLLISAAPAPPLEELGAVVRLGRAADELNGAGAMAGFKTMNYMVNRLALDEGRGRDLDEVYFTLADGSVTEGSRSTVFCVVDGVLRTTPLDLPILPGVTRREILDRAAELRIPAEEAAFTPADLAAADEVFLTGSVLGVRPVAAVDGKTCREVPGPLTKRLARAYFDDVTRDARG